VSPTNGAHVVTGAVPSLTNLKKATVMGIAPAPESPKGDASDAAAAPSPAAADDPLLPQPEPEAGAASATAATSATGVVPTAAATPGRAAQGAPASGRSLEKAAASEGGPESGEKDKEDTSPGLGQTRSRHEPLVPLDLPLKDLELLVEFIMDLAIGPTSMTWLAPLRAAVRRLEEAAGRGQRSLLEKALTELALELDGVGELGDERRRRILHHFVGVDMALPRPIDVAGQKVLRERLIVDQLLSEVSLTHPLISQRLRDEGPTSLERLARSNPVDLSEKLGAPREQAELVVNTFDGYLKQRSERGPTLAVLGKHRALKARVSALEASAEEFTRAQDSDDTEFRRVARRQRQADVAQLNLLLAELGEASILMELERCSVQGKIDRLNRWLSERATS
jgi:hypothetical protein